MRLLFVFPLCAMVAAAAIVEGRVVGATGQPLQGAAISTRLTLTEFRTAVSDANGEFTLDLPSDRAGLACRYREPDT